ncbi:EamA family transporter [Candidatus Saccharibacteria bacterium]|nr:MAG: EamA family transporter [Candidatus Saccharibacteria bacterium]
MDKLLIAAYVLTTAGGLVLLKLGTNGSGFLSIVDGKLVWNLGILAMLGILTYGISFLLYIILVSKFSLGYIVPLTTALVYILVFIASYFIFKEDFTSMKIVAIAMIIGGVILLNTTPTPETATPRSVERSTQSK